MREDEGRRRHIPEEIKEGLVWVLLMSGWWWKSQAAGLDLNMLGQCLFEDATGEQIELAAAATDDVI